MTDYMRVWQQASPGLMEGKLKLVQNVPQPVWTDLKSGGILVRVANASLNPVDYKILEMGIASRAIVRFPKTLGTVIAIAQPAPGGHANVRLGDKVMCRLDMFKAAGAVAEYAVVPHDAYAVLPDGVDLAQASGVPTAGQTAYQSIRPHVKLRSRIFINGGGGGTGTYGIQIAKALGCHVTVSCSTKNLGMVKALGADAAIDYRVEDVLDVLRGAGQSYDLVVDNVGDSPSGLYQVSPSFLQPDGVFVSVGRSASLGSGVRMADAIFRPGCLGGTRHKFVPLVAKNAPRDLEQLAAWLGEGTVRTVVESTFGFDEVPAAIVHIKKQSNSGKVIIDVRRPCYCHKIRGTSRRI